MQFVYLYRYKAKKDNGNRLTKIRIGKSNLKNVAFYKGDLRLLAASQQLFCSCDSMAVLMAIFANQAGESAAL